MANNSLIKGLTIVYKDDDNDVEAKIVRYYHYHISKKR